MDWDDDDEEGVELLRRGEVQLDQWGIAPFRALREICVVGWVVVVIMAAISLQVRGVKNTHTLSLSNKHFLSHTHTNISIKELKLSIIECFQVWVKEDLIVHRCTINLTHKLLPHVQDIRSNSIQTKFHPSYIARSENWRPLGEHYTFYIIWVLEPKTWVFWITRIFENDSSSRNITFTLST